MKFYHGFKFAIHEAFRDSLEKCAFQVGDVFYDTEDAYQDDWEEAKKSIKVGLQIPSFQAGYEMPETDFSGSSNFLLSQNWVSPLRVEVVLDSEDLFDDKIFTTTHGRLYTYLISGDHTVLYPNTVHPPIMHNIPKKGKKLLLQSSDLKNIAMNKCKSSPSLNKFVFVIDANDVSTLSRKRLPAIKDALQKIKNKNSSVEMHDIYLSELPCFEYKIKQNIAKIEKLSSEENVAIFPTNKFVALEVVVNDEKTNDGKIIQAKERINSALEKVLKSQGAKKFNLDNFGALYS